LAYILANFLDSLSQSLQLREALTVLAYASIGGGIGIYIRALYRRFGLTVANREGLGSNFSLLIVSTVLVIFVVKSSLALSLGLVGALSIVRFRAAIKEPEELIFLFFCIAVGLSLGAEYPELAVAGVLGFTIFLMIRHWGARKGGSETLLLTISGSESVLLDGDAGRLTVAVRESIGNFTVQRLDVEEGQVQLRAVVSPESQERILEMVSALRERMPGCRVSYVNLAHLL
jgi:hypothetical protein